MIIAIVVQKNQIYYRKNFLDMQCMDTEVKHLKVPITP